MRAFLYTWNPTRWNWVDFSDAIYRLKNGQSYDAVWSTGNDPCCQFRTVKLGRF